MLRHIEHRRLEEQHVQHNRYCSSSRGLHWSWAARIPCPGRRTTASSRTTTPSHTRTGWRGSAYDESSWRKDLPPWGLGAQSPGRGSTQRTRRASTKIPTSQLQCGATCKEIFCTRPRPASAARSCSSTWAPPSWWPRSRCPTRQCCAQSRSWAAGWVSRRGVGVHWDLGLGGAWRPRGKLPVQPWCTNTRTARNQSRFAFWSWRIWVSCRRVSRRD